MLWFHRVEQPDFVLSAADCDVEALLLFLFRCCRSLAFYGGHHRHEYHVSLRALEFTRARYLQLTLLKDRRRQHFDQLVLDFLGLTARGKQRAHTEGL